MPIDRRQFCAWGIGLVPMWRAFAGSQETSATPTFSTDLQVVNLLATVKDKHGALVKGLTKDDFLLAEDGRPQSIRYFSQETDLPLTLGLLVDTSGSERRMIGEERDASRVFFDQVLRPDKDKAFLIHFDHEVELLKDLTGSREELEKALALLSAAKQGGRPSGWPGGGGRRGGGHRPGGGYGVHGGTKLFDAVFLASDELMSKQSGRKALILLTDGEDNGSKTPLDQAVESAQRANMLAYSVQISDPDIGMFTRSAMDRTDGKKILQRIARETGGSFFQADKKKTIAEIYASIEEELRNQYSIGYTPDRALSEAGYRKIRLSVKRKDCVVQTRDGYYAKTS